MEKMTWKDWFFWNRATWFDYFVAAILGSLGLLATFFPKKTIGLFYEIADSSVVVEPQNTTTMVVGILGLLFYGLGRYSQLLYQLKDSKKSFGD